VNFSFFLGKGIKINSLNLLSFSSKLSLVLSTMVTPIAQLGRWIGDSNATNLKKEHDGLRWLGAMATDQKDPFPDAGPGLGPETEVATSNFC
jgi:hypothetical protein